MTAGVYRSTASAAEAGWIEIPLVVDPARDGYRLDRFLAERIARLSRTRIQAIIDAGNVRTAAPGRVGPEGAGTELTGLRAASRVRAGQLVIVRRPAPHEPPVPMHAEVIHEDDALLVLDKPAGLPVHASARYHRHTLTAVLRDKFGAGHPWVMAHRLDRETSGVMVFGRHGASAGTLKRAFQHREVRKHYLAIVRGELADSHVIDVPLGAAVGSRVRIKMGPRSLAEGGVPARTDVQPLAHGRFAGAPITLVACEPHTGRQHQIRVHLTELGHPVLGDKLYGIDEQAFIDVADHVRLMEDLEQELGLPRHALHSSELEVPHPGRGGAHCSFTATWPRELAAILAVPEAGARRCRLPTPQP